MGNLEKSREIINRVDKEIARLFEERMGACIEIAKFKKEHGLSIYDKKREDEILQRAKNQVESSEIAEYYVSLLEKIMSLSKSYQERYIEGMKVAYCGTEGAFAHIATMKLFKSARAIAYPSFQDAYFAVANGECDSAVLPVENSYNGEVGQVTDFMFSGPLFVNSMTELAVSQDLLVLPGTRLEDLKLVLSHPQALGQCADFITENKLKTQEYTNTALAAKFVRENGDKTIAAIASAEAAEIFGLEVLARNINSSRSNTTRFAVFSRAPLKRSAEEKGVHSIFLFTVRNEAGALAKAIEIIGKHGFNMRTLRSRPMKELLWEYYFYVEAEGYIDSEDGAEMMKELSKYCDRLKFAGTYLKT